MTRPIRIEGNIAYVTLTKGHEAVIDAADVPLVAGFHWGSQIHNRQDGTIRVCAARTEYLPEKKRRVVYMHREIAQTPSGLDTDHIDGNALNNRRSNLRWATRSQNVQNQGRRSDNSSGFKGVHWDKKRKNYRAYIYLQGNRRHLGYFRNAEDAAAAYAKASCEMHGEFGRTK